jgi:hypothetical protein
VAAGERGNGERGEVVWWEVASTGETGRAEWKRGTDMGMLVGGTGSGEREQRG